MVVVSESLIYPWQSKPPTCEAQKTSASSPAKTYGSVDEVANEYLRWLSALWNHLESHGDHKIHLKELGQLGIRHQNLVLSDKLIDPQDIQTTFFIPMDKKELRRYVPDHTKPETARQLHIWLGEWPRFSWQTEASTAVSPHNASSLCDTLTVAFGGLARKKEGEKSCSTLPTLEQRKGWQEVNYERAFDYGDWSQSEFWSRSKDSIPERIWLSDNSPHIMVTMAHNHLHDDLSLFRSEIQVIVSLMYARLLDESLYEDNIVPVMVLSATADKYARILQAHMAYDSLIIRLSPYYDFRDRSDAHLEDFLVYMAGDLKGTTQVLELPKLKWAFGSQ